MVALELFQSLLELREIESVIGVEIIEFESLRDSLFFFKYLLYFLPAFLQFCLVLLFHYIKLIIS